MDPSTFVPILASVLGITAVAVVTGFCCIRSMIVRNTGELHTRMTIMEQRLQYQIQEMNTLVQPPPSYSSHAYYSPQSPSSFILPNQPQHRL